MSIYEIFLSVVSIIIVLKGALTPLYMKYMRGTKIAKKGNSFVLNKMFFKSPKNLYYFFWASVIWLIVSYFFHKELIESLLTGM